LSERARIVFVGVYSTRIHTAKHKRSDDEDGLARGRRRCRDPLEERASHEKAALGAVVMSGS
jgi:hypothetical protein